MTFESSKKIMGVVFIYPDVHHDFRGEYVETFNAVAHDYMTNSARFVVDDVSVSCHKTIRGIHGDTKTTKLVQCLHGSILQFVIDFRIDSPSFLSHELIAINDKNRTQVLVPAGCGNGHIVLSDTAIFHYKQTEYYGGQNSQFQYKWTHLVNDFGIRLPFHPKDAVMSDRDANGMSLEETLKWLYPEMSFEEIQEKISFIR